MLRPAYPLETARLVLRPFSAGDLEDEGQTLVLAAVWRETATVDAMLEDEWVGRLSRGRPG